MNTMLCLTSGWRRRLLVLLTVCVCALGIGSGGQAQTDNEVLDTCSDIKALARQIMPGWAFQRLEGLSETECVDLLGGMTYAELKSALSTAEYNENPGDPRTQVTDVDGAFEGTVEEFNDLIRDRRLSEHIPGTTLHPPAPGWTAGQHSGDPFYLGYRWNDAGRETNHIMLSVELEHHEKHFHDWWNYRMRVDRSPYHDPWYHYYRKVRHDSEWGSSTDDGYQDFEMHVSYQHRKCHKDWWICLARWRSYDVHSHCRASSHRIRSGECF